MPIVTADELGGDYEAKAVKEGQYDLRVVSQKYAVSEKGNGGLSLGVRIEGEGDAQLVNEWLGDPGKPGDEYYKMRMRQIQGVLKIFGWPANEGFDLENDGERLVGATGKALLVQEEDKRDGSMRNRIRLPRAGR